MTKLTIIILFASLLFSSTSIYSQGISEGDTTQYLKRNSIQGSGGFLLIMATASGYYERIFGKKDLSIFAKGGMGTLVVWGSYGEFVMLEGGITTHSKKTNHFEASLGANYFFNKDFSNLIMPSLSAGYRLQKPGGNFVFRTGIGYFQGLYVGVGYCF